MADDAGVCAHDGPFPEKTIRTSPFATVRDSGHVYNMAKSAARALDIIEVLVDAGRPLRAVDIVRRLSLSPSSANQLLKTMVDSGYLLFDAVSKEYFLSIRLMRLGGALSDTYFGPDALRLLLDAVHAQTGFFTLLSASQGHFMQILDHRGETHSPGLSRTLQNVKAQHVSIFGSCSGAAWLASQSEATVRRTIRYCRRDLGGPSASVEQALDSIRRIREQGYAFGGFMSEQGHASVAVALPPAANGVVLILGVGGPTEAIERNTEDYAALMKREIARYITAP